MSTWDTIGLLKDYTRVRVIPLYYFVSYLSNTIFLVSTLSPVVAARRNADRFYRQYILRTPTGLHRREISEFESYRMIYKSVRPEDVLSFASDRKKGFVGQTAR